MQFDNLNNRGIIISVLIGLVMLVYLTRLFAIQVVSGNYAGKAERTVRKEKVIIPPRGNIYDRNGQLYVSTSPIFELTITPRELRIPDTTRLCEALEMDRPTLRAAIKKARKTSSFQETVIARFIEPKQFAVIQEKLWDFAGISFNANSKRQYHYPVGGHFLGYVLEVNQREIDASNQYYNGGDMKGKSGIESFYEDTLRGVRGVKVVARDNHGREVGAYRGGTEDKVGVQGSDLILGVDARLQAYGERLMQGKKGSIVAISPRSGEILAFISAPSYNPGKLTGKELGKQWTKLTRDSLKPLLNRPLSGVYPPGSIFKAAMALAALNEGVIRPNTYYSCGGGFRRNKGKPGCRMHPHPLNLAGAIKYSCNSYFSATYMDMLHHKQYDDIYQSFNIWEDYLKRLGIGVKLNIDIPSEKRGLAPTAARYDKWYGKNRWAATTVISNAIGQGEILMTPLQMANLAAVIANGNGYYEPHFVRGIRKTGEASFGMVPYPYHDSEIAAEHFEAVREGMFQVVATGTGRRAFLKGHSICGKTGTVENPHGKDHATFIAFAPRENPQIAIAIIVENSGGGGGTWAAPIAGCMIEQFLTGKVEEKSWEENRVLEANFINQ
ncbi:MAG: penicillin-binding protein 2 [Bacteroidia bacterium]